MRFHKEAEAGMRLRHPNIVQIIDQGQQDSRHFMIMEYVEGMNLREFLQAADPAQGPRGPAAHDRPGPRPAVFSRAGSDPPRPQGDQHPDLQLGRGQARRFRPGHDRGGRLAAHGITSQRTVDYSALERTCGSPKGDPRSDIYFLGCVFYHMLTGQVPLEDSESKDPLKKMLKRGFGVIKPISEHRHAPAEPLAEIIEKMMKMELKPDTRPWARSSPTSRTTRSPSIRPRPRLERTHARKYENPMQHDEPRRRTSS